MGEGLLRWVGEYSSIIIQDNIEKKRTETQNMGEKNSGEKNLEIVHHFLVLWASSKHRAGAGEMQSRGRPSNSPGMIAPRRVWWVHII